MQPKLINGKTLMMSCKELLSKYLSFAETKVQITEDDKKIIYHLRKSLLFDKGNTWMKKRGGYI